MRKGERQGNKRKVRERRLIFQACALSLCVRVLRAKARLTIRAADGGYAARFLSICLAFGFFRFGGESTLPPTAANANRWAGVSGITMITLKEKASWKQLWKNIRHYEKK